MPRQRGFSVGHGVPLRLELRQSFHQTVVAFHVLQPLCQFPGTVRRPELPLRHGLAG